MPYKGNVMNRIRWALVVVAVAGLAVCGCSQKLTYERFQTIHVGATPEAVEGTLGKPWQRTDNAWIYLDMDREISATVYLEENQVTGTHWQDPEHGMVGSSPNVRQPGESERIRAQKIE
ncbi:MAG: hypothetical protein AMXMBFR13_14140 [Phycisphaerae bacterium]